MGVTSGQQKRRLSPCNLKSRRLNYLLFCCNIYQFFTRPFNAQIKFDVIAIKRQNVTKFDVFTVGAQKLESNEFSILNGKYIAKRF